MGLVASNLFDMRDAPKFEPALIGTACFGGCGALVTALLGCYMIWDNKRRDKQQGVKMHARDIPTSRMRDGPKSEDFRWYL
jgi:hypothetical protein